MDLTNNTYFSEYDRTVAKEMIRIVIPLLNSQANDMIIHYASISHSCDVKILSGWRMSKICLDPDQKDLTIKNIVGIPQYVIMTSVGLNDLTIESNESYINHICLRLPNLMNLTLRKSTQCTHELPIRFDYLDNVINIRKLTITRLKLPGLFNLSKLPNLNYVKIVECGDISITPSSLHPRAVLYHLELYSIKSIHPTTLYQETEIASRRYNVSEYESD